MSKSPVYFVECAYPRQGGARSFREIDRDYSSRDQVIRDIIGGEYSNVVTVLEVREDDKTCHNITEDIAREVQAALRSDGDEPTYEVVNFLHQELGTDSWPWAA